MSNDNEFLATASDDSTARITNIKDGTIICTVRHSDEVWGICLSQDKKFLVTTSSDSTARITRVKDGATICSVQHKG